jgi:hypothetical protein
LPHSADGSGVGTNVLRPLDCVQKRLARRSLREFQTTGRSRGSPRDLSQRFTPKAILRKQLPFRAALKQRRELIMRDRSNPILIKDFDYRKDLAEPVNAASGGIGFSGSIQRA